MESVELIELFSRYGLDAVILSLAAAGITVVLDRFLFRKLNLNDNAKKAVKFLPYALGILFYAIYSLACNAGIGCFFENLADTVRQGIAVGTLGFALCLLINKIIDGKGAAVTKKETVEELIEGYICPNETENVTALIKDAMANGNDGLLKEIIEEYASDGVTEAEIEVLVTLIIELYNKE